MMMTFSLSVFESNPAATPDDNESDNVSDPECDCDGDMDDVFEFLPDPYFVHILQSLIKYGIRLNFRLIVKLTVYDRSILNVILYVLLPFEETTSYFITCTPRPDTRRC